MPDQVTDPVNQTVVTAGEILGRQFDILRAYLERPAIQQQLLLLLLLVLVALVLSLGLQALLRRVAHQFLLGRSEALRESVLERWLPAINQLNYPIAALVVISVVTAWLRGREVPVGLISASMALFWALLAYQIVLTVLYALFTRQTIRRYHLYVFNPAFVLVLLTVVVTFLDIDGIASFELGVLFETSITLGNLLTAVIVFYIFIVVSWLMQDVVQVVLDRLESDPGLINSVITILRYVILILGVVATLSVIGFSPTTLAAIAGGLSLGAGLGLQRIIANFSSGIVLLLEQSVRPGDVIVFEGEMGVVKKLNIRSTIVNRFDNVDMIIPNENLTNSTVVTYNTELARKRVEVRVGVSYDANPSQVRKVLVETAEKHGLVIDDPPPAAFFLGFGDSSLDFVLWAWVKDNGDRWGTQSDLHYMVAAALREYDIEIPYPQRDLHLRSGLPERLSNSHEQHEALSPPEDRPN